VLYVYDKTVLVLCVTDTSSTTVCFRCTLFNLWKSWCIHEL